MKVELNGFPYIYLKGVARRMGGKIVQGVKPKIPVGEIDTLLVKIMF